MEATERPIGVMVVADPPLMRQGISRFLDVDDRFEVIAEAASGYEAIRRAEACQPQIILLDDPLPGVTSILITVMLRKRLPDTRIVLLSSDPSDDRLLQAVRAGASAYLPRGGSAEQLLATLRRVMAGDQPIFEDVLERPPVAWQALRHLHGSASVQLARQRLTLPLSQREIEVLDCIARGLSSQEIAEALCIVPETVQNHVASMIQTAGVNNRVQLLLHAVRNGWVDIGRLGMQPAGVAPGSMPITFGDLAREDDSERRRAS